MLNLILFVLALLVTLKAADAATRYASSFAQALRLSRYTVGVILVAMLSVMPETLVSVSSAIQGQPLLGFGTLLGSNIADLTLILGIVVLAAKKKMVVEKGVLKASVFYMLLIGIPVLLALDGYVSRYDGVVLIAAGAAFIYAMALKEKKKVMNAEANFSVHHISGLILNIVLLLIGSYFTVRYALDFAQFLKMDPMIMGLFVIGLGTTLPEFTFALRAVRKGQNNLAFGDILGTVVIDATIVIGLVALIAPFDVPMKLVYVSGNAMALAGIVTFWFLNSRQTLTKIEGVGLILFYIVFACVEFFTLSTL